MNVSVAAICHQGNSEGDALVNEILRQYQQQGWQIKGLVTEQGKDLKANKAMSVRDLDTGDVYIISQTLGPDARGCRLDLGRLAEAGQVLRKVVQQAEQGQQPNFVFINRYGHGESQGKGFQQEFADIIAAGIPLLTLVAEKYLTHWQEFTGGIGDILPLEREAIMAWLEQTVIPNMPIEAIRASDILKS